MSLHPAPPLLEICGVCCAKLSTSPHTHAHPAGDETRTPSPPTPLFLSPQMRPPCGTGGCWWQPCCSSLALSSSPVRVGLGWEGRQERGGGASGLRGDRRSGVLKARGQSHTNSAPLTDHPSRDSLGRVSRGSCPQGARHVTPVLVQAVRPRARTWLTTGLSLPPQP